jgi:hypothetical protein
VLENEVMKYIYIYLFIYLDLANGENYKMRSFTVYKEDEMDRMFITHEENNKGIQNIC